MVSKRTRGPVSNISSPAVQVGAKQALKGKAASALVPSNPNNIRDRKKTQTSEAQAVVIPGGGDTTIPDAISISSGGEEEEGSEDAASDIEMGNTDAVAVVNGTAPEEEDETGEPSFGELLRNQPSEPVDIAATLGDKEPRALITGNRNKELQLPSGVSLATVLNQSLKTNDNSLLESCLLTTDIDIVRTTIMRMDSSLAAILLQKLAERLSRSPGRYGSLLIWVQWVCVAHGGVIAGQQDMLRRMKSLFRAMDERSGSLPSLLLLKGKLDMLDAQMGLRNSIKTDIATQDRNEDEENVIYIEGQDDEESDEDDGAAVPVSAKEAGATMEFDGVESDDENELDDGISDADEGLLDVEAEESNEGSSDNEESLEESEGESEDEGSLVDFVVDTEDEEEDLEMEESPPTKKPRTEGRQRLRKNRA